MKMVILDPDGYQIVISNIKNRRNTDLIRVIFKFIRIS
jgi:hypothetical protein